ncbi:MAG: phosphoglyceromutase [Bacteroidetes bacterium]|nr:MAG: phosphoglyceromutase [Bacteroidota bacterium]
MKKRFTAIGVLMILTISCNVQQKNESTSQKVILITLDGFRWQELFSGIDKTLMTNENFTSDSSSLKKLFWKDSVAKRREALLPFIWNTVSEIGQIHGNRTIGSQVNLTNSYWFSYPGYNEILSGKSDDNRIQSNDKVPNPNQTILELANVDKRYSGKVGAFASWDVFPYIINEERSGVPVNAGFDIADGESLTKNEMYLNKLQVATPSPWSTVRLDVFTHHFALEYLKKVNPDLLYISYGETDDFAHNGNYDAYIKSANTTDKFIEELWNFTQDDTNYKDKTTFIITTDHGRGTEPIETWRSHGSNVKGADEVWLIAFGAGVKPLGEISSDEQLYSNQIAGTIAKLLGLNFDSDNPIINLKN